MFAKDVKNDDYTITVDEVEESELPLENEPLETAKETTPIIQGKDEGSPDEVSINTTASDSTNKKESRMYKMWKMWQMFNSKNIKIYT